MEAVHSRGFGDVEESNARSTLSDMQDVDCIVFNFLGHLHFPLYD